MDAERELVFLDPAKAKFTKGEGGYLTLDNGGEVTACVRLKRALPYRFATRYLCVCDREEKEIGMISDLSEWSAEQQALVEQELERLYYTPKISKILSAKDRMGYLYFEAVADGVTRSFAVRDPSRNIRFVVPGQPAVQITDTEGNRYRIDDPDRLDAKSRRTVETYLI